MAKILIDTFEPKVGDRFFVDTNVLYWISYVASKEIHDLPNPPKDYQVEKYPAFIEKVLNCGGKLYTSPLLLSELANIIESSEFEIYKKFNPDKNGISKKKFRKIRVERKAVVDEIRVAWDTIGTFSQRLDNKIDENFSNSCIELLESSCLDAYDASYVIFAKEHGINYMITDDKDFLSVDGVQVLTA